MAVTSINITRVSQNLRTMNMLDTLRRNTVDLYQQQNRLATGRRLNTPSDDPVAAAQSLKLKQNLTRQDQILGNLRHADLMMSATDDAMSEINDLINQAEAIASQSIGSQADGSEREANAALIKSIRERLTTVGNRQVNGRYIFAGRDTQNAPFVSALGGVAYLGDTGDALSRVSRFEEEPTNLPGNLLFGALSTAIRSKASLEPALTRETRLEDLNGTNSQGVRKGTILLVNNDNTSARVDLSIADTVGDVVDIFNAAATAAGINATVEINGGSLVVNAGSVQVTDVAGGKTASDLGLIDDGNANALAAAPSTSLKPRLAPGTLLSSLNGGQGLELDGALRIANGLNVTSVDLTGAVTVQDITNRINSAGIFVTASITPDGDGIEIISQVSGAKLTIGEDGGKAASQLGLRTLDESSRLETLNFGRGVEVLAGQPDLTINARDGSSFDVNLDGAETLGDVIKLINDTASEAGISVVAGLDEATSGIALTDGSGGDGGFSVTRASIDAFAVEDLGLDKTVTEPEVALVGDDVGAVRAEGLLTALIDLENALSADDERALTEITQRLVEFNGETSRIHGVVGARARAFQDRIEQTENAVVTTQTFLSEIEDLDYTEAVTRFQQAQTALQANLLSGSQLLNISLLDFLA